MGTNLHVTLGRALKILGLIESRRHGIRPSDIGQRLGISPRSTYRYLNTLSEIKAIYTEKKGRQVYYKILRDES